MSFWQRLLYRFGLRSDSDSHTYELDAGLHTALEDLAQRERRPPNEVISELVASGLDRRFSQDDLLKRWQSLSRREQEVLALVCLGQRNNEIAGILGITTQTVKTHLQHIFQKFGLRSRKELRLFLQDWDFAGWWDNHQKKSICFSHRPISGSTEKSTSKSTAGGFFLDQ